MDKLIIGIAVVMVILTGFFIWGLGEVSKQCEEKFGADFSYAVSGSYGRCVNPKGEAREL